MYINAPIKQIGNLEEESKMENRIIQSLVEHDNASFWQTKNQIMEIENTPSKNVIVSNLEETVSAHTGMKKNISDIPKKNTQENVSEFPMDHIDAVD